MRRVTVRKGGSKMETRRRRTGAMAVLALLLFAALTTAAWAQEDPYGNGEPQVKPTLITNPSEPEVEVVRQERGAAILPFTGGDVTLFLAIGLGAISVGVVMLKGRRAHEAE